LLQIAHILTGSTITTFSSTFQKGVMPFSEKCWTWWSTFRVPNGQLLERQEKSISTKVVNFLTAKWSTSYLPKTTGARVCWIFPVLRWNIRFLRYNYPPQKGGFDFFRSYAEIRSFFRRYTGIFRFFVKKILEPF